MDADATPTFDLKCARCGKDFATPYATKLYCTSTCRALAKNKRYFAAHPERRAAKEKRRVARNPERSRGARRRAAKATFWAAHPEAEGRHGALQSAVPSATEWAHWEAVVVERKAAKALLANPEYITARATARARRYLVGRSNLTPEQYDAMLAAQGGVCAICRQPETRTHHASGQVFSLAIDHDHRTGDTRGLLCFGCNVTLGKFNDDPEILAAAMAYLTPRLKGVAA